MLRKPLSFHAVSFGPYNEVLRRMTQIALQVQNSAPTNTGNTTARLAETFLGFAEALKKPRGSLMA